MWLLAYPSEVATRAGTCASTPTYPADAVSDTRTFYDGATSLTAAPTRGEQTETDVVDGYTGTTAATAHWIATATSTYDAMGRAVTATDPRLAPARTATTAYTPAGAGITTAVTVTNPLGWKSTTTYDPHRAVATQETDENAHVTTATYDALGRRTQVWLPDRPQASNAVPSLSYAYTVSQTAPTTVATTSLNPAGGTLTSYQLYDGLLRPRQTQTPAEGGGRDITDTFYDNAGRVFHTDSLYYTQGTPGGTLFVPGTVVPGQAKTVFDGAGRPTASIALALGSEVWRTSYDYGADYADTIPPAGQSASRSISDAQGHQTRLLNFHGRSTTGAYDTTSYSYLPSGAMKSMTDAAGNSWGWTHDVLGNVTSATDPDTGTTTTIYDAVNRAASTTDARHTTLAYTYDALDRRTAEYSGSTSGAKLAAWTYDTISKGQPASSSRYAAGAAYTTTYNSYDAADRLTSQSLTIPAGNGALTGKYTTAFSYGANGALTYVGHTAAGALAAEGQTYGYDELGNVGGVGQNGFSYVATTTYDALGQIDQYGSAGSSHDYTRAFTYADGTRRLTEDTTDININQVAADHHYTYTDAGTVTEDQNVVSSTVPTDTQCFTYDYANRLAQAWTPSSGSCTAAASSSALGGPAPYWQSYTYDTVGDRTSRVQHAVGTGTGTTATYTYPAAGQGQPNAVNTVTTTGATSATAAYGYDAAGNTTTRPGQTVGYDPEGRASTVAAGTKSENDIYTADGDLLLLRTDSTGQTLYYSDAGGSTEVHQATGATSASASRTYLFAGQPVAVRTAAAGSTTSTVSWLISDNHSTTLTSINSTTGTVTHRYLDPFGNTRGATVAWADDKSFLDDPTDPTTNTQQVGARVYDPTLGRFLTVDPALETGDPQALNGYAYANNDPVNKSDPSGRFIAGGDGQPILGTNAGDIANHHADFNIGTDNSPARWGRSRQESGGSSQQHNVGCGGPCATGRPSAPTIDPKKTFIKVRNPNHNDAGCQRFGSGLFCDETKTISLSDLMHPYAPKNYCGTLSWLCTLVGANQAANCGHGDVQQCIGAVYAIGADVTVVGKAGELLSLGSAAGDLAPSVIRAGELKLPGVPEGAAGVPVQTAKGYEYTIPRGTPEVDPRVTSVRIMDPVTTGKFQYPGGYAVYMNGSGQTVNPVTGQVIGRSDPFAHIGLR